MTMQSDRNRRLRHRRSSRRTITEISREFAISRTRVVQILEQTGGDPLATSQAKQLEGATILELEGERARLRARIASDRRRLRMVQDELSARATDRILGLAD